MDEPYYRDLGNGRFISTVHAQGTWNADEQHMASASALLTHVLEREHGTPGKRLGRVGFDIHGVIHAGEFTVCTTVIRPGRTIELVQADMWCGERIAVSARGWFLATSDTSGEAAVEDEAMDAGVDDACPWEGMARWPGGYIASVEFRTVDGGRPGARQGWMRSRHPLVDSAEESPLAHLMRLVDTSNGVSARMRPEEMFFANLDLQVHAYRDPSGEWLGVDSRQQFGPDGIGLTSTVLHDVDGPFGRAEQILTLRRR